MKKRIIEMYQNHLKPKTIGFKLRKDPEKVQPTKRQIKSTLETYRKEAFGKVNMTVKDLDNFISQHMDIPEGDDEPFIATYERKPSGEDGDHWFRYFMTTKRLIRMSAEAKNIHTDATYKLCIHGYPVIPIGSSDMGRHFHLIGIAITTNDTAADYGFLFKSLKFAMERIVKKTFKPDVMIADGAQAIQNGFEEVFGKDDTTVVMCWFHVMQNLQKQKLHDDSNREAILNDIRQIHHSYNNEIFDLGCQLFADKWKESEETFVEYFTKTYVKQHKNWFMGATVRAPWSNNASESFNSDFKRFQTFWERKSLAEFKINILESIRERSNEYIMDKSPFQSDIPITNDQLIIGQKYANSNMAFANVTTDEDEKATFFLRANADEAPITQENLETFMQSNWETFDDFKQNAFSFYQIVFESEAKEWKNSTCTCPAFGKYYMCKHVIAIAFRLRILSNDMLSDPDYQPLVPKKKRGRPKKASKGLSKE